MAASRNFQGNIQKSDKPQGQKDASTTCLTAVSGTTETTKPGGKRNACASSTLNMCSTSGASNVERVLGQIGGLEQRDDSTDPGPKSETQIIVRDYV